MLPAFEEFAVWLNLVLFGGAAAVVWLAGMRLSAYADAVAERTGIGKVFIGALLLGGVTSLPEGATVVTASAIGNAPLAVNNLLGGVAFQVTILAIADFVAGRRALSTAITRPSLLLEAALLVLLLAVAATVIIVGDMRVLGVGVGAMVIFLASIGAFFLIQRHDPRETWEPEAPNERAKAGEHSDRSRQDRPDRSLRALVVRIAAAGLAILVAGFIVARTADVLARQTGIGSSFVGAVLVAIATSLPEISTTLGAVRIGEHALAISNLFGANILDVSLLLLADLVYPGQAVLNEVGPFAAATALLGILLAAVYLVGMLERRKRIIARVGVDSLLVLCLYVGGLFVLYHMR